MAGLRVAVPLIERLAIEGEAMVIPTKDDVLGDHAMVYGLRAHARFDLLTGRLRPFVVIGAGMHVLRSTSPQMSNDVDPAYHWGGGVRWALNDHFDVRIDGRQLFVPDREHNGATTDYEFTAGLTYRFGSTHVAKIDVPPLPGDRDHDGIPDDVDKCPDQPEDKDGFQDEDGCPDPDNDHDGIPDVADKCPNEPETKNGYQDEDGCPDQVIQELAGIGFELGSAKIDAVSAPILERAVQILHDHADDRRRDLRAHVVGRRPQREPRSIAAARRGGQDGFTSSRTARRRDPDQHGRPLAPEDPVADNATDAGRRRQNRRIEFTTSWPPSLDPGQDRNSCYDHRAWPRAGVWRRALSSWSSSTARRVTRGARRSSMAR